MKQGHAESTHQQSDRYDAMPFGEIHELLPLPIATKERCLMPVLIILASLSLHQNDSLHCGSSRRIWIDRGVAGWHSLLSKKPLTPLVFVHWPECGADGSQR
jgi:hypothetical protein